MGREPKMRYVVCYKQINILRILHQQKLYYVWHYVKKYRISRTPKMGQLKINLETKQKNMCTYGYVRAFVCYVYNTQVHDYIRKNHFLYKWFIFVKRIGGNGDGMSIQQTAMNNYVSMSMLSLRIRLGPSRHCRDYRAPDTAP